MALADPYPRRVPTPNNTSGTSGSKKVQEGQEGRQTTTTGSAGSGMPNPPIRARLNPSAVQYQRTQVETASPTRLVILLYEGAIRFCQIAQDAMVAKDLPRQHKNLINAQNIITELLGSINHEQGGEIAENLSRLYAHMLEQLVTANLYDRIEQVKAVQGMLRELRASWVEVEIQLSTASNTNQSDHTVTNSPRRRLGDQNA